MDIDWKMDAIKLCATNKQEINSLIHNSQIYSNYNKMVCQNGNQYG